MDPITRYVNIGKWSRPRPFRVVGSFVELDVVMAGCNCAICIDHLVDVVSTLRSKKISYSLMKRNPDGWAINIDLRGVQDPIKHLSDALGLPITIDE